MQTKQIIYIILIVIWLVAVFLFSNQNGDASSDTSGKMINGILKVVGKNESDQEKLVEKLQPPIRKLAHLTLYFIGGVFIALLVKTFNIPIAKQIIYSQIFLTIYAVSDEFHQLFSSGRGASIIDIAIDSIGGFVGIILTILL